MKLIPLSKGKFAKVDDHWFKYLNQWKWHFDGAYARRNVYHYENGKKIQEHIFIHRIVVKTPPGMFTDHIDGDTLNDQESNLRICTNRQNAANMKKRANLSSRYKGVTKRGENSFRVTVWKDNQKIYDAHFPNERWAAMSYNLNAAALFGSYARLNFSDALVGMSVDASSLNPQSGGSHTA